ncbi:MAG TPA: hypothetical protein DEF16_16360 [Gemmobacter sp.]|nr:hypothetical protein [Gemmobacter sp.]
MPAPRATEAAIRRAIGAWKAAGLQIGKMEVTPEGKIILTAPVAEPEKEVPHSGPRQWRKTG